MNKSLLDMVWSEKYRPQTLEECVLPERLERIFGQIIEDGELPNLLLYSKTPGVGKTTIANVLINELNYEVLSINGSSDRNIDVLRTDLTRFCSAFSIEGKRKVVIIDEADFLNASSTQPALRGFIQEFSSSCSFIFTCNHVNKLMDALRSRFSQISFDFSADDKKAILPKLMERACFILDEEGVQYNPKVIAHYVKQLYPDFRRIINELQKVSKISSNNIDSLIKGSACDEDSLIEILKKKKFTDMRKWVAENHSSGIDKVADIVFRNCETLYPENQAEVFTILFDYMYKDKFAVSSEICIAACLSEIFLIT